MVFTLTISKPILLLLLKEHYYIGNEVADHLTKRSTAVLLADPNPISYNRITTINRHRTENLHFLYEFQEEFKDTQCKDTIRSSMPEWPSRTAVAFIPLTTGHRCLGKPLHRMEILAAQVARCVTVETPRPMNINHSAQYYVQRYFGGQVLGGQK